MTARGHLPNFDDQAVCEPGGSLRYRGRFFEGRDHQFNVPTNRFLGLREGSIGHTRALTAADDTPALGERLPFDCFALARELVVPPVPTRNEVLALVGRQVLN